MLTASAVAGCASGGSPAMFGGGNATVAFEAIDGPPAPVFEKLVGKLNDEAQARQIPVVSRTQPAQYRVRGYVSAQVEKRSNTIAWVWDVYDRSEQRALRISGAEPAGRARRDAWASADDKVLARIAQTGMAKIAEFLGDGALAPAASPPPVQEGEPVVTVAQRDDFAPEASGISRRIPEQPSERTAEEEPAFSALVAQIPMPRRRPEAPRALTEDDLMAYAASHH